VYGERLYVLYDGGFLACFNALDGSVVYERQRIPEGGGFTASPWAYGDHIFCLNEDGVTFVMKAGDKFELVRKTPLANDDMGMATPAVAGDRLLIRTSARLYCIRNGAKS
jgi:outer membrane protein assembly factor BamB